MAEEGKNKSRNGKYSYGGNYRRNHKPTKFDTLTLTNKLKHAVSVYVMNEKRVPKRWRYINGKPAIDYARTIRDYIVLANGTWLNKNSEDENSKRKELQQNALSYCNVLQMQLIDICAECEGATEENMREITDMLNCLVGKIINWIKSDSTQT